MVMELGGLLQWGPLGPQLRVTAGDPPFWSLSSESSAGHGESDLFHASSPSQAHRTFALAPVPTVTGHPAPPRWPCLSWSHRSVEHIFLSVRVAQFLFRSYTPVFKEKK